MNQFKLNRLLKVILAVPLTMSFCTLLLAEESESLNTDSLAAAAKEVFRVHCAECHTGENARSGVEILDHEGLIDNEYVVENKPDDSVVYQLITSTGDDVMPPSNRPSLNEDEITTIRKWIVAGAVAFPVDVDANAEADVADLPKEIKETETNIKAEAKSKSQVPANTVEANTDEANTDDADTGEPDADAPKPNAAEVKSPTKQPMPADPAALQAEILDEILNYVRQSTEAERAYLRFFSIRHLVASGITQQRLDQHRHALAKTINHLSHEPLLVTPTAIDSVAGGTIFAVDIRKLGWHKDVLVGESNGESDAAGQGSKLNLFDLALLEYPYAVVPEASDLYDRVKREFLTEAEQVRPIPYVRADWFCSTVLLPPLYHDFLQVPRTLKELEAEIGVDVQANLDSAVAQRAGMTVSGVSRNNRAVERHPQRNGYYWKSHDFQNNIGVENILANPIDFHPSGGEMIYSLPNGMQAYFVTNARGTRIGAAPTEIVVDKFASDHVVRNGLGCIRCHSRGIKEFNDVVRPVIDVLPGSPGFDKRKVMELYPGRDVWKDLIKTDQASFIAAIEKIGMSAKQQEPLSTVSDEYLENTINISQAAAEIGVDEATLSALCRSKHLIQLGLAPLSAGGVIRRDALQANFSLAVDALGLGISIPPIDGNLLAQFSADDSLDSVELRTNKANNFFEPGDRMRVFVPNRSNEIQFVEVYGNSVDGEKVSLTGGQIELAGGETFEFPATGEEGIEIRPRVGRETITLYFSDQPYPEGVIHSGKNIDDRVVHAGMQLKINKKTIAIETR